MFWLWNRIFFAGGRWIVRRWFTNLTTITWHFARDKIFSIRTLIMFWIGETMFTFAYLALAGYLVIIILWIISWISDGNSDRFVPVILAPLLVVKDAYELAFPTDPFNVWYYLGYAYGLLMIHFIVWDYQQIFDVFISLWYIGATENLSGMYLMFYVISGGCALIANYTIWPLAEMLWSPLLYLFSYIDFTWLNPGFTYSGPKFAILKAA